jgi:hypothetical protein
VQPPGNRSLAWREQNQRRLGRQNNGVMFHGGRVFSLTGCHPRQLPGTAAATRGRSSVRARDGSGNQAPPRGCSIRPTVVGNGRRFCFRERRFEIGHRHWVSSRHGSAWIFVAHSCMCEA